MDDLSICVGCAGVYWHVQLPAAVIFHCFVDLVIASAFCPRLEGLNQYTTQVMSGRAAAAVFKKCCQFTASLELSNGTSKHL